MTTTPPSRTSTSPATRTTADESSELDPDQSSQDERSRRTPQFRGPPDEMLLTGRSTDSVIASSYAFLLSALFVAWGVLALGVSTLAGSVIGDAGAVGLASWVGLWVTGYYPLVGAVDAFVTRK